MVPLRAYCPNEYTVSDREQEAFRLMNLIMYKTSYVKYNRISQILDPVNKTEKLENIDLLKIKEAFLLIYSKTKCLVNMINMIDEFLLKFNKNIPAQIQEIFNSYYFTPKHKDLVDLFSDWLTNAYFITYGITGCGVFKAGIQNWKGFCIKINCSQMKLLNSENWTNGEPQ